MAWIFAFVLIFVLKLIYLSIWQPKCQIVNLSWTQCLQGLLVNFLYFLSYVLNLKIKFRVEGQVKFFIRLCKIDKPSL